MPICVHPLCTVYIGLVECLFFIHTFPTLLYNENDLTDTLVERSERGNKQKLVICIDESYIVALIFNITCSCNKRVLRKKIKKRKTTKTHRKVSFTESTLVDSSRQANSGFVLVYYFESVVFLLFSQ